MNEPLLSICCQTYNHKDYIEQAIEGFLMQQTDFHFEILLRDDASNDGTQEIVEAYAAKYPEKINPLIYSENQFQKGISPFRDNVKRAKGKYIAICEGDDYWTDPLKLQKQVDFMEGNPEFGLVYTNFDVFDNKTRKFTKLKILPFSGSVLNKLILDNFIATLTVCFRAECLDHIDTDEIINQSFKMGDYPMWLQIANKYKIKYLDEITCVYRVLPNSASHFESFEGNEIFCLSVLKIQLYYRAKFKLDTIIEEDIKNACYLKIMRYAITANEFIKANYYSKKIKSNSLKIRIEVFLCKNRVFFRCSNFARSIRILMLNLKIV